MVHLRRRHCAGDRVSRAHRGVSVQDDQRRLAVVRAVLSDAPQEEFADHAALVFAHHHRSSLQGGSSGRAVVGAPTVQ